MKEHEVSTAERLDAKLTIRAMRKHDQLWRVAEGRMTWAESIGFLLPVVLIAIGLLQVSRDEGILDLVKNAGGAGYVALGLVLVGTFIWSHFQRQLNALRELLRRLERERS